MWAAWQFRGVQRTKLLPLDLGICLFHHPFMSAEIDWYMWQNMRNILSMSDKVGYLDIHLTMICNTQWPRVKQALLSGQSITNSLDLAARFFVIKLRVLVFVIAEQIFRELKAYFHVLEFPKRGLPHVHYTFFLTSESKPHLLQYPYVDTIRCAEISSAENRILRQVVFKHNI